MALQELCSGFGGWWSMGHVQTPDQIMWNSVPYLQRWRSRGSKQGRSLSCSIVGDPGSLYLISLEVALIVTTWFCVHLSAFSACLLSWTLLSLKVRHFKCFFNGASWLSLAGPSVWARWIAGFPFNCYTILWFQIWTSPELQLACILSVVLIFFIWFCLEKHLQIEV